MLALLDSLTYFFIDFTQFIFNISWLYLTITFFIIFNLILFLNATNLIKKITFFFIILILCSSIIWLYSLETLGFILIITELTLIFLFFIVATQFTLKIITTAAKIKFNKFLFLLFIIFIFNVDSQTTISSINYYQAISLIITADYFFIYYFLNMFLDLTIIIALILGLFSIYFIILYYQIKFLYQKNKTKLKTIYLVRKQNMLHQAIYSNYLRWFQ